MLRYSYNNVIIIVTNAIVMLEFLIAPVLHPGSPRLLILSFLTRVTT